MSKLFSFRNRTRPLLKPENNCILDLISIPAAGYSLRRLLKNYNGYLIRVRRSSDNLEKDIGFDGDGFINTAVLLNFVGTNSGYISKWYDQSGNGINLVQTAASYQPRIVNAGVFEDEIYFDGNLMNLYTTDNINFNQPYSSSVIFTPRASGFSAYKIIYRTIGGIMNVFTASGAFAVYSGNNFYSSVEPVQNKKVSLYTDFNASSSVLSVNKVLSSGDFGALGGSSALIVPSTSSTNRLNCGINEIIIFNRLIDRIVLEANQADFYGLT